MTNLSDRLKELRKEKKITQSDLGKILGVVKTTISMYENSNSTPNDEIKLKISEYFNVSLDYLLGKTDIRNYEDNSPLNSINEKLDTNGLKTLAAHFDEEEFTEDDLDDIENFIKFIVSKKKINK